MSWLQRVFGGRGRTDEPRGNPERVAAVEEVLEELRPALRLDGGDVRLVAVGEAGEIELELVGACRGCAVRSVTLEDAIEPRLRQRLEWVSAVRDVRA